MSRDHRQQHVQQKIHKTMADQTFELYIGSATGTQIDNAIAKVAGMEETLSGTAATIPSSAAVKNYVDGKSVDTESTLSGNASKIPSSKAVKDVTDTLLPKTDATFLTSKTKTYYTVFNEDNTTVIEGYKYTAGDDVIVTSAGERCYLIENIDFESLYLCGRGQIAIIDNLNGTALVNRVYSRSMNPYYSFASEGQTRNYQGKKLLLYFQNGEENIYSSDYPTTNKWGGAFGVSPSLSEAELLLKALEQNGKSTAIVAAYNTDGDIGDYMVNALVNSNEKKNFIGSGYVGKLSLSPSAEYTDTRYRINYCPNITHLNIDVSGNSSINDIRIAFNYGLTNLRIKANNTQSINLLSNNNLQTLKLEGSYKLTGRMFQECHTITHIDLTNAATSDTGYSIFNHCTNLEWLDISNIAFELPSKYAMSDYIFDNCSKLETIIGDHTVAEVEAGTITCFTGLKFSLKLSYCPLLSRASLLATIKGLYDFSQDANFDSETAYATLTLGDTLSEKLEENDIDILIAKGWDFV